MLLITSILALIISISLHEFCHALAADKLGDPTPRAYGRLTLNPLAHIDPVGTVLIPLIGTLSGLPVIGWAKPTPIDPYNFQNPRRDEVIVALAGPLSNFLLAFLFSRIHHPLSVTFVVTSLVLGIFNLLPLPPLDGSKILLNLLPLESAHRWQQALEQYGHLLIILLLFSGLLSRIMNPILAFCLKLLY